jgi:hypothetical protein
MIGPSTSLITTGWMEDPTGHPPFVILSDQVDSPDGRRDDAGLPGVWHAGCVFGPESLQ